jgi:hypothetical protein
MDTDSNKTIWTVVIVAAVAIMGGLFVKFVPNLTSQMQVYAKVVTGNLSGSIDSDDNSKFQYSVPDETNDTITITGYTGNATNLIIPEYRKLGLKFYKITKIHGWAFQGQTSLKSVTINDNITEIGAGAFQADSNLAYVDLPNSLTTIGDYAFQKDNISTISIPANLAVGKWAFNQNPITDVTFRGAVSLDSGAFTQTKLSTVTLPKGSTYDNDLANNTQSFDGNVKVNLVQ